MIKILKPGIEDVLVADMNFVYIVARILEFLNPELTRTSLVGYFIMVLLISYLKLSNVKFQIILM